jgi:hypothetical protein
MIVVLKENRDPLQPLGQAKICLDPLGHLKIEVV